VIAERLRSPRSAETTLALFSDLLGDYRPRDFGVRLWDGSSWEPDRGQPERFTLLLRHPGALRRMFLPPSELALAKAFIHGDFDIEGDIEAVFPLADYLLIERKASTLDRLRHSRRLLQLPANGRASSATGAVELSGRRHSLARDLQAISYHYDRSNEFFAVFLDRQLVYSCAYFVREDDDLASAQRQKLDYICRKLRLRPGERLLDIGCGWGALLCHAATHYGVRAHGVTLAREQYDYAKAKVERLGLEDRVTLEFRDYSLLDGSFDKIASIGMFEHVGIANHPTYFQTIHRLLRPRGLYLHHAIARRAPRDDKRRRRAPAEAMALLRYIFPGGEVDHLGMSVANLDRYGFEVHDVEAWREHYARTTRLWHDGLLVNRAAAEREVGSVKTRLWLAYLAGCSVAFERGTVGIFQTLVSKRARGASGLPLTRENLYKR
jgi:cyclopropane-fatty-acyl-phospholipid synthase